MKLRRKRYVVRETCWVAVALCGSYLGCSSADPTSSPTGNAPGEVTLSSVAVWPSRPVIDINQALQLQATGSFSDGGSRLLAEDVVWTSSNRSVAEISPSGLVTGRADGQARMRANVTASGLWGEAVVTVRTTAPPPSVDWCRLQFPRAATVAEDVDLVVIYGRVAIGGITDKSPGVDAPPTLKAQAGYGPNNTDPQGNPEWRWLPAEPNAAWDGTLAGEPNNDEYMATLVAPPVGRYDLAFRFSLDGGVNWLLCDLKVAEGDGSANGYQVENAGVLEVVHADCLDNPCTSADPPSCDGEERVTYLPLGECASAASGVICTYEEGSRTHCSLDAGRAFCAEGLCLPAYADWCRLQAPREMVVAPATAVSVYGRVFVDGLTSASRGVDIHPALLAQVGFGERGTDPSSQEWTWFDGRANQGWQAKEGDNNDEYLAELTAWNEGEYDVAYRFGLVQKDPAEQTWRYCDTDGASYESERAGKLRVVEACNPPPEDTVVDWCRLQFPRDLSLAPGAELTAFGHLFEAGISDRSPGVDGHLQVRAQLGVGPDDSVPTEPSWLWVAAAPNPSWDGGQTNNDEYMATVKLNLPEGSYDFAFRFSRDCGESWLYCDTRNGAQGGNGPLDDYKAEKAGQLRISSE